MKGGFAEVVACRITLKSLLRLGGLTLVMSLAPSQTAVAGKKPFPRWKAKFCKHLLDYEGGDTSALLGLIDSSPLRPIPLFYCLVDGYPLSPLALAQARNQLSLIDFLREHGFAPLEGEELAASARPAVAPLAPVRGPAITSEIIEAKEPESDDERFEVHEFLDSDKLDEALIEGSLRESSTHARALNLPVEEHQAYDDLDLCIGQLVQAAKQKSASAAREILHRLWVRGIALEDLYRRYVERVEQALLTDEQEAWVLKQNAKLHKGLLVQTREQAAMADTLRHAVAKKKKKALKNTLRRLAFSRIPLAEFMRAYKLRFSDSEKAWVLSLMPQVTFWDGRE